MFCSWDIWIFVFLWNPQISKSVTSSQAVLHHMLISLQCYVLTKWNLIKYYCPVWWTFLICFPCWSGKLVPGPFMILLKWQYSKTWPFLVIDIYHFQMSLIHLFKKNETLESWHDWLLSNWSRLLNWKEPGT